MIRSQIGVIELAVIFAAIAYVLQIILDSLGISRTSRTLRTENKDMVRRNKELDTTVLKLQAEVARLENELTSVRLQVADLAKRDQSAVLAAIADHERQADLRAREYLAVAIEIRDAVRGS